MKNLKTCKVLTAMATVASLSLVPMTTQAVPFTGSISFNGNMTAYTGTAGSGPIASDFTTAHSIVFGTTYVSAGANGSFSGIPQGATVTSVYSPLQINNPTLGQAVLPASSLWAVGGFTFTLSTLIEPFCSPNIFILQGVGTFHDNGAVYSDTTGTWSATFTSASANTGVTFSWNSSSAAVPPPNVTPDSGTSVLLLGMGVLALAGFAGVRRQVAA
jgi:hypothetical protein